MLKPWFLFTLPLFPTVSIVVTVVGGLLTILVIWTRPALRKLVNAPLASLSCAGILYATLFSPFWIQQILNPQWEPPPALCWFLGYSNVVLGGVSVTHMLCIALQRYFKICTNSILLNATRALVIMLLLTWLVPMVSFLPLYVVEEPKVDPKLKRCSLGRSDKLWAKIPTAILVYVLPYIAALAFYTLIQNHVTKPVGNLEGVVWVGDEMSTSSDDGQKSSNCTDPSKQKSTMILVAPAPGTGQNDQGKKSPLSDEEQKGNCRIEQDKVQNMTLTAATVSDQTGQTERQQHAVPFSSSQNCNSAAERQITKMMMMLFAVYTLCFMPLTLMVFFSSKVPAEAFTVGQLLAALNGALNPIVYGVMNKNIRQGYKNTWDRVLNFIM
ncbi:alpha-2 adrenergic receptor-like [Branchiostoma floridae]|uniref:Alpha-2 adrenergic receptor-like n=1 Tax=Branchiostoma floridae TaxID=7739 RepID=A0A9J7HS56_BRAFL|nr:alpha-2 adrenergic receptor-like [Branchiostoma floridae]